MTSPYFTQSYQRAFGTFPLKGDEARTALQSAIDVGYRAIDTAQMYANEAEVGQTLSDCGIPRSEFLITTKVKPDNFKAAAFIPSVEQSVKDLQLDQIDVLLLHWPPVGGDIDESVGLLVQAKDLGLTRHIGVSNYTIAMLQRLRELTDTDIVTNQVEFHPLLNQDKLLRAAEELSIPLSSYCSVARGKVFDYPLFSEIGNQKGVSAAQVVLRWILQKGVSINTKSATPENIKRNFDIVSFSLSEQEMASIDELTQTNYRIVDDTVVPWAPVWD